MVTLTFVFFVLFYLGLSAIQPKYPAQYMVSGYSPSDSYFSREFNPVMVSKNFLRKDNFSRKLIFSEKINVWKG